MIVTLDDALEKAQGINIKSTKEFDCRDPQVVQDILFIQQSRKEYAEQLSRLWYVYKDAELKGAVSRYYRKILMEVALRVSGQYFDEHQLDLDAALKGFDLRSEESTIISEFARCAYNRTELEDKTDKEFHKRIKPYKVKGLIITPIASGALFGIIAAILSKDSPLNIELTALSGVLGYFIGTLIEKKYHTLVAHLAGIKARAFGDSLNPKQLANETLIKLQDPNLY